MPANFEFLTDYRISLCTPGTDHWVSGYVRMVDGTSVQIECPQAQQFAGVSKLTCYVVQHGRRIDFTATVQELTKDGLFIKLNFDLRITPCEQVGRYEVQLRPSARINGVSIGVRVLDISVNGIGLQVSNHVAVGSELVIDFSLESGLLRVPFVVRHCEPSPSGTSYQLGAVIDTHEKMVATRFQTFAQSFDPFLNSVRKRAS
ncbi:MAG: PilZ domain-containing protein [Chthonomonas sp.]|nr:PilZ domain-containing protein [Chthonomonas sp.]